MVTKIFFVKLFTMERFSLQSGTKIKFDTKLHLFTTKTIMVFGKKII
jgi:hypothetical protein